MDPIRVTIYIILGIAALGAIIWLIIAATSRKERDRHD
jgi:uncharacterized membrane protein YuzA (DUF378 family)